MKRIIYSFALVCMSATMLMAQADYKMWSTILMEPKLDKILEFEEGLAKHNKQYHNEGTKKVSVWQIMSGSNAGKYMVAMGPLTFTDYDSFEDMGEEHKTDWHENVLKYAKSVSDHEYWRLDEKLSRTPEGSSTGKEVFRVYDLKPSEGYRFNALMKKVAEVGEKIPQDEYLHVFWSEFASNSGRDVALAFGMKSWASLDAKSEFSKDYEEVHGEGSWRLLIEELQDVVIGREDELSLYRKDLSGGE